MQKLGTTYGPLGRLPTPEVSQEILPRAKLLYDEKTRLAKESLACIDGHVLREDGHFKAPRMVNTVEKGGI